MTCFQRAQRVGSSFHSLMFIKMGRASQGFVLFGGEMLAWLWLWLPERWGWALQSDSAGICPVERFGELTLFRADTGHRSRFQVEAQYLSL